MRPRNAAGLPRTSVQRPGSSEEKSARIEGRHVHRRSRESRRRRARFGGRGGPESCWPKTSIDSSENSRWVRRIRPSARQDGSVRRQRRAQRAVGLRSVPPFAQARAHPFQETEEERLERTAQMLLRELERARGVAEDLSRLETGRIVEEPAAARVHQESVALELQEADRGRSVFGGERTDRVAVEEPTDALVRRIEHDLDRVVARRPGIAEDTGRGGLVERTERVTQPVERLAQGSAPRVTGRAPRRASAVVPPARDPVRAAPGSVRKNLRFAPGRKVREVLPVVRQRRKTGGLDRIERAGERTVALAEVVPVRLPVRRDVDELRSGVVAETGQQ